METFLRMERSEPKHRLPLSDGGVYVVTLIAVVFAVVLRNDLTEKLQLPQGYVQLGLYALLAGMAYLIYRTRLLGYRYTLTDRTLRVERLVGARTSLILEARLRDLDFDVQDAGGRIQNLHAGSRCEGRLLKIMHGGRMDCIRIAVSEEFMKELKAQWEKNR